MSATPASAVDVVVDTLRRSAPLQVAVIAAQLDWPVDEVYAALVAAEEAGLAGVVVDRSAGRNKAPTRRWRALK